MINEGDHTRLREELRLTPPGSEDATHLGCICPVIDNHYGRGRPSGDGRVTFIMVENCPVHGEGVMTRYREAGR